MDTVPDVVAAGSAADNAFAIPRRTQNREANCKIGTQGGENVTGARAALRFAPSDKFDLTFTGEYINDTSEARADTLVHIGRNPMTGRACRCRSTSGAMRRWRVRRALRQPLLAAEHLHELRDLPRSGDTASRSIRQTSFERQVVEREGEHPLHRHRCCSS